MLILLNRKKSKKIMGLTYIYKLKRTLGRYPVNLSVRVAAKKG
jgi:hypothetical protein